jgi:hypothetical protein
MTNCVNSSLLQALFLSPVKGVTKTLSKGVVKISQIKRGEIYRYYVKVALLSRANQRKCKSHCPHAQLGSRTCSVLPSLVGQLLYEEGCQDLCSYFTPECLRRLGAGLAGHSRKGTSHAPG